MSGFIFTTHVVVRMRQRGIRRLDIRRTVYDPDQVIPSFRGRRVAQRRIGTRTLEVVFTREGRATVIVTAYWLEA